MDTITIPPMSPREYRRVAKAERVECAKAIRMMRNLLGRAEALRRLRAWHEEAEAAMGQAELPWL